MADIVHAYTHKITYARIYPWSGSLLVRQVVLRFDLDTVGQSKPTSLSSLFFLALSLTLSPSLAGSVSLPLAVWMAGPTALGCLGSGGIPISSSNHDIILPK